MVKYVRDDSDLQLLFTRIMWRIWFLAKLKLFRHFLTENFGDLVMSVFVSKMG